MSIESDLTRGWQCFLRLRGDFWPHGALPVHYEGLRYLHPFSPHFLEGYNINDEGSDSRLKISHQGSDFIEFSGYFLNKTRNSPCSRFDDVPGFTLKMIQITL